MFNFTGLCSRLTLLVVHGEVHLLPGGRELPDVEERGQGTRHQHPRTPPRCHHPRLDEDKHGNPHTQRYFEPSLALQWNPEPQLVCSFDHVDWALEAVAQSTPLFFG